MPHTLSTERGVRTYVKYAEEGKDVARERRPSRGRSEEKVDGGQKSRTEEALVSRVTTGGKKVSRWESGRREECLNKMMEERSVVFELKGASFAQTSTVLAGDRLAFS